MSPVTIEFWPFLTGLASLLVFFLAFVFGAGKLLLSQVDKRLEIRFKAMEDARAEASRNWDEKFRELLSQMKEDSGRWQDLERDFLKFQAALPVEYVRREDFIRSWTVIEAKLDGLALKIENMQLRGLRECQ